MLIKHTTKNFKETQKLGEKFVKEVLSIRRSAPQDKNNSAVVLGLTGNLGGGKTTFLQGFAKGLGVKEKILSPTFVIMKRFKNFYHIDCYRLKNEKDILELGFKDIIKNPKNIVAIEWPEKIKKVLPKNTILIKFKFIDNNTREIIFKI
jgi:tRNA threonylcarbamoyladenosine biosynthesis protein TsaE